MDDNQPVLFPRALVYNYSLEESVPAVWQSGDIILDLYEVLGELGKGGMGIVYKVRLRSGQSIMAVKCPRQEIFTRAGGQEDFRREAETWAMLGAHPHLVRCHFVHTLGSIPRVFAEYIEGGTLSEWIRTRKLYQDGPEQALVRILDVAIQCAWGLHFAHEQGLVHQDVKPANVMMTLDGTAKITDFGLAKARALAGESAGTGPEQNILVSAGGMTPAYCSPEQAKHQPLGRKTDIWSWDLLVLEMFVGQVTWMAGVVAREALASHKREDAAIPLMPPEVVTLLGHCFQDWPEDRPATLAQIAADLQAIYARLTGYPYPRTLSKRTEEPIATLADQAFSFFHLGRFQEAVAVYERFIQRDPQQAGAYVGKGYALQGSGKLQEAVIAFDQALAFNPKLVEACLMKGNVLQQMGHFQEAVLAFDQAIALNSKDASIYSNKGNALRRLDRFQEALATYDRALALDSRHVAAYINKGNVFRELGKHQEALAAFDQAIVLDPGMPIVFLNKGNVLADLQRFQKAVEAYEQALVLDPHMAMAQEGKERALRLLEESRQTPERATNEALALYRQGTMLWQTGQSRQATAVFKQALALDPKDTAIYLNSGVLLMELGQHQDALAAFDQAIALDPKYDLAYSNKGIVLRQMKRFQEALVACEQALALKPQDALAHMEKGNVLWDLGKHQAALAAFDHTLGLSPNNALAYFNKGKLLHEMKRPLEALAALSRALALDPNNGSIRTYQRLVLADLKKT